MEEGGKEDGGKEEGERDRKRIMGASGLVVGQRKDVGWRRITKDYAG
ncbi:hypothetical protein [Flavihumibacter cheonanensis]